MASGIGPYSKCIKEAFPTGAFTAAAASLPIGCQKGRAQTTFSSLIKLIQLLSAHTGPVRATEGREQASVSFETLHCTAILRDGCTPKTLSICFLLDIIRMQVL